MQPRDKYIEEKLDGFLNHWFGNKKLNPNDEGFVGRLDKRMTKTEDRLEDIEKNQQEMKASQISEARIVIIEKNQQEMKERGIKESAYLKVIYTLLGSTGGLIVWYIIKSVLDHMNTTNIPHVK